MVCRMTLSSACGRTVTATSGSGPAAGWDASRRGKFSTYTTRDGLSNNYVTFIYQDREGTLWVGTGGGGLNRYRNGTFTAFTTKDGLSSDMVTAIHEDENGTLWVGTSGGGLNRFSGSKFTSITTKDGLFDDKIFQILEDRNHNFWMSSNRGIFRVERTATQRFHRRQDRIDSVGILRCLRGDEEPGM